METGLSVGLGLLGFVLTVLLIRSFRAARAAGHVTLTFVYVGMAVLLTNCISLVSNYTGGTTETGVGLNSVVTLSAPASMVSRVSIPLLVLLAGLYVFIRFRQQPRINGSACLYLLALLMGALAGWGLGFEFLGGLKLALFLMVAAMIVAPRNLDGLRGAAYATALLVTLSGVLALVDMESAAVTCGERKCSAAGVLFNGVAASFNSFGWLVAIALPVMYFGLVRYGLFFAWAAGVFGFASGSRTAQVAIAITLVLITFHRLALKYRQRWWRAPAVIAAAGSLLVSATLPLIDLQESTLTGRPGLWDYALGHFADSPFYGVGPDRWASFTETGEVTRASIYSTHNQFVEILFVTGLAGLLLFGALIITVVRINRGYAGHLAILMVPILICGVAERPWSLGSADWLSWSILVVLGTWFGAAARPSQKAKVSSAGPTTSIRDRIIPLREHRVFALQRSPKDARLRFGTGFTDASEQGLIRNQR